jgi:hypothetical protein
MATTLAAAITSARVLCGDSTTDNLSRNENLDNSDIGNLINGSNKTFQVVNYPIVPGGEVSVIADGTLLALTTGYTVNEPTGQFSLVAAPSSTLYVTYYYYLMPDSVWTEFVTWAVQRLNLSTGNLSTDVGNVPEGLLSALKLYSVAAWARRIAAQTGLWYDQKLQERNESRDDISKKFLTLGVQWEKDGDNARDSYYNGAGTQLKPSFRVNQMTPRGYTPYR